MNHFALFLLSSGLWLASFTSPAMARVTTHKEAIVHSCHDGDTCKMMVKNKKVSVRFSGIDTPELKQKFGKQARDYTKSLIVGKTVELECNGKSFKRSTCTVLLDGQDIGIEIVKNGWAWDSPKYSKGKYKQAEATARQQKLGMWSDPENTSPYCFRHPSHGKCRTSVLYMP